MGYDVMQVCDAAITVSGTVTLELAMIGVPMVIIYKVSPLTYMIGKRLIRVDHIGLCNIVAGERAVRELIQDGADPARIAEEITRIIMDVEYADGIRARLVRVRNSLGKGGSSVAVAKLATEMLA
jgi:lipid-A-disaccharide synthase